MLFLNLPLTVVIFLIRKRNMFFYKVALKMVCRSSYLVFLLCSFNVFYYCTCYCKSMARTIWTLCFQKRFLHCMIYLFSNNIVFCSACVRGKCHQLPFYSFEHTYSRSLKLVYTYISFVDAYTKFTWIYLIHHKSQVKNIFQFFINLVENQIGYKITVVQSDNAKEYLCNLLSSRMWYSTSSLMSIYT